MKSDHVRQLEHVAVATGVLRRKEVRWLCLTGRIRRNGRRVGENDFLEPGDKLEIRRSVYDVVNGGGDRLGLHHRTGDAVARIATPVRVHCGYHKCLTMLSRKIYRRASIALGLSAAAFGKRRTGFRHFFHRHDAWLENCGRFGITSMSGHCPDLDRFDDIKVVRFIRDPRDLVISGYFYHKRAGEHWCRYQNPTEVDFEVVNGAVPSALPKDRSLTDYLNEVTLEEGLAAEIEFRRHHLESMMRWPGDDDRVRTFRYEEIMGNEAATFREIFSFFDFPERLVERAARDAHNYRAGAKEAKKGHSRNPRSRQWQELFSPELNRKFVDRYEPLLRRYRYPLE